VTIGLRTGGDDSFFFDSIAQARLRWVDAVVTSLGEPKLELRCMKRDEV
jgi:hypothetical protein